MCCFSQSVEDVSDTSIFARGANGRQFLVYRMTYAAVSDLAMVLPLPCPPKSSEDAVRFINLDRYPMFFDDMMLGFRTRSMTLDLDSSLAAAAPLKVHDVGDFDASFVPTLEDFARLDDRFRIPDHVWAQIPAYNDYGFAVFKLKGGTPARSVHPMAFEFPRRDANVLYFPTIHIHDGSFRSRAEFDHLLYCQVDMEMHGYLDGWFSSEQNASEFMYVAKTKGIVDGGLPCWSRALTGKLENKDTLLGPHGSVPSAV